MNCAEIFQFCWNVAITTNTSPVHLDHNSLKLFLCKSYRCIYNQKRERVRIMLRVLVLTSCRIPPVCYSECGGCDAVYSGAVTSVSNEYTASFVRVSLVNLHNAARHLSDDHLSSHRGLFRLYSSTKHSTGTVLNQAGVLFVWSSTGEFLGHTVEGLACFAEAGGCVGGKGNLACCSSGPINLLCAAGNVKLDTLTGKWICMRIMTCIVLCIFSW
jgi:hypothetical protein